MEINEENCQILKLWIITPQFQLKKQTKLLTLTTSCEKRRCLIKNKKNKKQNQNNNNNNNSNNNNISNPRDQKILA